MGTKDSKAKEYLSDNTRFSEICNYVLFDGEKVIKPENLKECDSTEVLSVFGIDRKQIVKQKWRDLLKGVSVKYTESVYIVLMGIEAQTDVHYSMPVKTMIYDAMNYGEQVNEAKKQHQKNKDYKSSDEFLSGFTHEDRLTPVITITLYLGTKNWDGPRSLVEMMPHMDERFRPFINDYRINLLNPLEITDFSKFKTGLRPLFEVLKNASDEGKLNDLITKDETFTRVDVETVAAINLFVGTDIKYDEKEVRRLSLAGEELSAGEAKIIDVALKYGYDTPESFFRAFTRFHGIAPSEVKRGGKCHTGYHGSVAGMRRGRHN